MLVITRDEGPGTGRPSVVELPTRVFSSNPCGVHVTDGLPQLAQDGSCSGPGGVGYGASDATTKHGQPHRGLLTLIVDSGR